MTRAAARRPRRASGSMGRNHLRVISRRARTARWPRSPIPDAAALADAVAQDGRRGLVRPAGDDRRGRRSTRVVIAAPTTAHGPSRWPRSSAGSPSSSRSRSPRPSTRRIEHRRRGARRGRPAPGRPRRALQPGRARARPAARDGLARARIYSITSRRAGPFPARIRDVGVTIDLATHDADILSWIAGERPSRVYAETAQRIHADARGPAVRAAPLPVRRDRHARRQLAHAREAPPARRRRRGGHVRARLPDPAADVHAAPTSAARRSSTATRRRSRATSWTSTSQPHEPLAAELDAFLAVVRDGGRPVVDGEDGLWAVAIARLLEAAARGAGRSTCRADSRLAPA